MDLQQRHYLARMGKSFANSVRDENLIEARKTARKALNNKAAKYIAEGARGATRRAGLNEGPGMNWYINPNLTKPHGGPIENNGILPGDVRGGLPSRGDYMRGMGRPTIQNRQRQPGLPPRTGGYNTPYDGLPGRGSNGPGPRPILVNGLPSRPGYNSNPYGQGGGRPILVNGLPGRGLGGPGGGIEMGQFGGMGGIPRPGIRPIPGRGSGRPGGPGGGIEMGQFGGRPGRPPVYPPPPPSVYYGAATAPRPDAPRTGGPLYPNGNGGIYGGFGSRPIGPFPPPTNFSVAPSNVGR